MLVLVVSSLVGVLAGCSPSADQTTAPAAQTNVSAAQPSAPAAAIEKLDMSKSGVSESGLWRYEHTVSSPGSKSEGYHGKLLYNGVVLPEPANPNGYYQTPWGPMFWVGEPNVLWGTHGWMPSFGREPAGQALPIPSMQDKLIVCAEILASDSLATPDRLESKAWVLADLEKFGVKKGHVQQDWFRLGKESVTIHDTKRWGTAQMRLGQAGPDKPLTVELIGRGTLLLTPPQGGVSAEAAPSGIRPKMTQAVELPRQAGATRLVKYTLTGLPFDEGLDLYLAFRVESLGRILVVGPEANGTTVTVKDVDTVMIRLPGEDPNKAVWEVTSVKGKAVETLGRVEYEGDTSNPFGIALNGTFKACLRVLEPGRATVDLAYHPWTEENKPAGKSFKVNLDVQAVKSAPEQTAKADAQKSRR
jgi:predicted secreted protein